MSSSHVALYSDATRSKSGILTPTSDGSLNRSCQDDEPRPDSRGSRYGTSRVPMEDLLKPTIVVKPHPASIQAKPRILHPLMLLPREHLPLSSLDLAQPHGDFSASRFYESHVKVLDLEGRLGSNLLIARSETNRVTYAIEQQNDGLYTVCKLGAWVDMVKLSQLAMAICRQRLDAYKPISQASNGIFALTTPQLHKDNKKKRLAIEEIQSMVKKRARSQSVAAVSFQESNPESPADCDSQVSDRQDVRETTVPPLPSDHQQTSAVAPAEATEAAFAQPTAEDIFQNIRTQYAEALYHSMGSLAYFAKGPLSRARAAYHLDCDANLEMVDLVEFLKSLIMTTVVIDKKYRETMPALTSKFKTFVEESDNGEGKTKKRKPKKMKMGKDGLYPAEEEHIRFWWNMHKSNDPEEKSASGQELKYHISCLRRRETQLQMIIIMEILALEPLARPKENAENSQLPGVESQTGQVEAAPKKRNKHNLPVLLDVHADRLCIWQSTTLDEVKALAESQDQSIKSDKPNSDPLKDFCVDVILPFFSARLPEICDSINRKLGGPVMKEPLKPRQSKPTTSQTKPRPRAPAKKPSLTKQNTREKTLERVLSDERMRRSVSRGPTNSALAHMRSASATVIPGLKKEASDSLLNMIPKRESSLKPRTNSLFSRSSSTSSLFQQTEDQKAKKKAALEAELKEAITALKRPNRALAGQEIVQEVEQRKSLSQLKKAKKPVHRVPGAGAAVHIKATPANNRFKDVIAAESQQKALLTEMEMIRVEQEHCIPASSCVPSSAVTRRVAATPMEAVQATPARGTAGAAATQPLPTSFFPVSPILSRKAVNQVTSYFSVPGSGVVPASSPAIGALFETPLKPRSAMGNMLRATPVRPLRLPESTSRPGSRVGVAAAVTPETGRNSKVMEAPHMIVGATPRRPKSRTGDTGLVGATPQERGLKEIPMQAIGATPRRRGLNVEEAGLIGATPQRRGSKESLPPQSIGATPVKKAVQVQSQPVVEEVKKTPEPEVSIYQKLGWDDDYDLD